MEEIIRMQENLLLIRRTVGWTATEMGEKIGVTRQTINNIESGRNKLTKTQYIALRSVLDAEINSSPEDTEMLSVLLEVLVDNPEKYGEKVRSVLADKANLMAPGILVGSASREKVSKAWMADAAALVGIAMLPIAPFGLGIACAGGWLLKVLNKNKAEKEDSQKNTSDREI